jgi:septum formation protein
LKIAVFSTGHRIFRPAYTYYLHYFFQGIDLLVLASTSPYRSELLKRLQLPFVTASPDIDETPRQGESARATSERLSQEKAQAVAANYPDALIIGSDQVALLEGRQIGKPLTHENATRQLRSMSGKTTTFYTALTLLNSRTGQMQTAVAENFVTLRDLSDEEIEGYLLKEQPYQCAGSAKSEGLGIALMSSMRGDDPNALIGLPLILLLDMLRRENIKPF